MISYILNNNGVVSKILPVCYNTHSYNSYVFLELASFFYSDVTSSDKREIWTCTWSKAAIKLGDLLATILFKLVDSYLIAFKLVQ